MPKKKRNQFFTMYSVAVILKVGKGSFYCTQILTLEITALWADNHWEFILHFRSTRKG